jgi:uroporphyrin-3 C-methyltransferase
VNTDISEIENNFDDKPSIEEKPRSGGAGLALLAFILALSALAGTGWMWWQGGLTKTQGDERVYSEITRLEAANSELTVELNRVRGEVETLADDDSGAQITELRMQLEADRVQVGNLEQTIRDQLALTRSLQSAAESMQGRLLATEATLAGLSSQQLDAGGELDLAEVDYLLRLANERLMLFSDPVAADQALEIADSHLAAMDNPLFLGVRREIALARADLAAVNIPDYAGISGQLDTIAELTSGLAFQGSAPVSQTFAAEQESGWWEKIKGAFSNLVTVRRSTVQENERISLEDQDYIRQSLWLQLEIAQLSLVRREQGAFTDSVEQVRETLSTWFDSTDIAFQSALAAVDELLALEIEVDVPDISGPWSTIRLVRQGRARPMPPEPVNNLQQEQQEPGEIQE